MNEQNRYINLVANLFVTQFKKIYYYTNKNQKFSKNLNIIKKYLIGNY